MKTHDLTDIIKSNKYHADANTGKVYAVKPGTATTPPSMVEVTENDNHRYSRINLRRPQGGFIKVLKHRFIWTYFNGPVPADVEIDHIDGDKLNNKLSNLQLLTHAENIRKHYRENNTSGRVRMVCPAGNVHVYESMRNAALAGGKYNLGTIVRACTLNQQPTKGIYKGWTITWDN